MIQLETLDTLPAEMRGAVLVIGNFDGVHRGHRGLIDCAKRKAAETKAPVGVLTFEPHPRAVFRPDDPPFRLTSPAKKLALLAECGIDFTVSSRFDWDFASQSAEQFAGLVKRHLDPSHIVIGADFRFGQLRKGTVETLRAAGLAVTGVSPIVNSEGEIFASTAIRTALRNGDIARANDLLGWDWEISGPVFRGDRRGHELGYPTANILLADLLHPAYGIYASLVHIDGEDGWHKAATNIGIRPMFELKQGQVEAHILDFPDRDIYDRILTVRPVRRLRGEAKFASLDELIAQIEKDCDQTRAAL